MVFPRRKQTDCNGKGLYRLLIRIEQRLSIFGIKAQQLEVLLVCNLGISTQQICKAKATPASAL